MPRRPTGGRQPLPFGFMSVGGEWFGMWMSQQWNGVPSAFRFFMTIGVILVYVAQRDEEIKDQA